MDAMQFFGIENIFIRSFEVEPIKKYVIMLLFAKA